MTDLTWDEVLTHLRAPKNYWLATTTPTGGPHTVPVWGVVYEKSLYLYSERNTVKAQNLAVDDRAVVHLESGSDVLIVHGHAREVTDPEVEFVRTAFTQKYSAPNEIEWVPTASPQFIVWRLDPTRARSWQLEDMDGSQRRWQG